MSQVCRRMAGSSEDGPRDLFSVAHLQQSWLKACIRSSSAPPIHKGKSMATESRDVPPQQDQSVTGSPPTTTQIPTARPLTPSEFNTAMVHLYRGEVSRANTWRTRLDGTTNWAVLTTGGTLSFAFSSPSSPHIMILLNSLLIGFFLLIEAHRYRY